jgi:hypothetical protein
MSEIGLGFTWTSLTLCTRRKMLKMQTGKIDIFTRKVRIIVSNISATQNIQIHILGFMYQILFAGILEPIISELYKVEDYCNLYVNPTLLNGLVQLVRKKPADPIIFLAEWLLLNNPFQPTVPYRVAMAPT